MLPRVFFERPATGVQNYYNLDKLYPVNWKKLKRSVNFYFTCRHMYTNIYSQKKAHGKNCNDLCNHISFHKSVFLQLQPLLHEYTVALNVFF